MIAAVRDLPEPQAHMGRRDKPGDDEHGELPIQPDEVQEIPLIFKLPHG